MATQETEFDGTVWFLTRHESGKVHEIENDAHVSLLYSDPANHNFVSAKGRAQVSRDKAKIHDLWNPMFKAWFPEGEDDPAIAVLKVDVTRRSIGKLLPASWCYGIKYLAAAVTGGSVDVGETRESLAVEQSGEVARKPAGIIWAGFRRLRPRPAVG